MEKAILLSKNPWWKGKEHFKEDEDYIKWNEKKIKWIPTLLNKIEFKPFSLHFLFGPRQVGKTTLIKFLIKKLLDEEIKPESIFYFRCDELKDYKELEELLSSYFEFRREQEIKKAYIFLDEITFAEEWFRTIKSWIDDGKFKEDVLLISGSASLEIKKQTEYFPGRRGEGKDFLILPLSFREFLKIMAPELHQRITPLASLELKEIKEKTKKIFVYINELNNLLNIYFKCGGFPLAINSYIEKKEIDTFVKETYLSWIKNDIVKVKRNVDTSREILKSLFSKIPSPVSWEAIAKETSIKSPKTINAYLHMLRELFVVDISYFLDTNNLTIEFGKNKKIHFLDPLFYDLFSEWCLIEVKDKDNKKAEDIVASHIYRFVKNIKGFSDDTFYWKNGFEVDVVVRTKTNAVGFEVKWANKIKPIKAFLGKMKDVYIISKNEFKIEEKIIPMSIFLSLLN